MKVEQVYKKPDKQQYSSSEYFRWILKNGILALIAYFLVFKLIDIQPGYNWIYNGLLKGNMEIIKEYPNITDDQKWEYKLGSTYTYLRFLKENTPPDAIILYPDANAFFPKDKEKMFTGEPYNKMLALRFLYPRKLIIPSEIGKSHYASKATHVAIVNGFGYDKLNYQPEHKIEHGVLPINPKN
ncbi:MAG: hypothetical protein RR319_04180 [Bacteroides sp.]